MRIKAAPGGAAGPASAPGSALGDIRRTPGHAYDGADPGGTSHAKQERRAAVLPSLDGTARVRLWDEA